MRPAMTTVHVLRVHLADHEWGNRLMELVAEEALLDPAHAGRHPLVVTVHEHGGWWLSFALIDGRPSVVYTANDAAAFAGKQREFREAAYRADWQYLPEVWRNDQLRKGDADGRPAA